MNTVYILTRYYSDGRVEYVGVFRTNDRARTEMRSIVRRDNTATENDFSISTAPMCEEMF